jgi:glycosyltransferase involved in cell wall biosynthesis
MLAAFLRSVDRRKLEPVVAFMEPGPLVHEVTALGLDAVVVPAGRLREPWNVMRTVRALALLLEREEPDLVLNWMAKTHLYGAFAAMLAHRSERVVWWQHTVPGRHWLDRSATLLPALAVGCSSRHSASAQAAAWPRRRVFVVHPGIEAPPRSTEAERDRRRAELGIPSDRHIVGLVGRLEQGKRHDRFLDVVDELLHRGLSVHGLIVGGSLPGAPDGSERLRAAVRQRGLEGTVTLTGHVADARQVIELMDVLVSVAVVEAFGIALVEAMALGVPVVAVAAGGPDEIIEDGRSGLLVPVARRDGIAEAVGRLVQDHELHARLSAGAVSRFHACFDARRMSADIEAAIRELCAA